MRTSIFWLYGLGTITWIYLSILFYSDGSPGLGTYYLMIAIWGGIAAYISIKEYNKNNNIKEKEEDESIIPADIECQYENIKSKYRYESCYTCSHFINCNYKYIKEDK